MWEPGTAAPPPPAPSRSPLPNGDNGSSPKKSGSLQKRLSSGTMGMRFMQRKVEAEESAKKQAKQEAEERARTEKMQWNTSEGISSTDCDDSEMSIGIVIPLNASAADVHGVAAEIVGRRSFGGFNKSVGDTWKEAVESKARERSGAKAERRNISDEELLRRYEKYVKGKADMTEGEVSPIGNLEKKRKKDKNRGGKRKR